MSRTAPGSSSDATCCQNCGRHVSRDFRRTFGDSQSVVHRCFNCDSRTRVLRGSAAGKTVEHPDPQEDSARRRGESA